MKKSLKSSLLFSFLLSFLGGLFSGGGILFILPPLMVLLIALSFPGFAFAYLLSKKINCELSKLFFIPILTWWMILFGVVWALTGYVPVQVPVMGFFWLSSVFMGVATVYFIKPDDV